MKTLYDDYKPLDFVTITDDNLNHKFDNAKVRICLGREYSANELDSIRNKLIHSGAVSVGWMKEQEKIIDAMHTDSSSVDPIALMSTWYEIDKPDGIQKELLLELCKDIEEAALDV